MRALVLADGDTPPRARLDAAWPGWADGIGLVVAADGGARHAAPLGFRIDRWVGDADSIDPAELDRLAASGVPLERVRQDKDASDTELAVRIALDARPRDIVLLGAFGGARLDHAIANLGLPMLAAASGTPVVSLTDAARVTWLFGPGPDGAPVTWRLAGHPGDLVTLLPLGAAVDGVPTHGLRYPLVDEPLPAGSTRGLSNLVDVAGAEVRVRSGALLVVEVPARLDR